MTNDPSQPHDVEFWEDFLYYTREERVIEGARAFPWQSVRPLAEALDGIELDESDLESLVSLLADSGDRWYELLPNMLNQARRLGPR